MSHPPYRNEGPFERDDARRRGRRDERVGKSKSDSRGAGQEYETQREGRRSKQGGPQGRSSARNS